MTQTDPTGSLVLDAWGRDHLDADIIGWLTTRAPDGRLQTSPISFLWEDGTVLFYSQPATPKLRNIAADPNVAFALQSDSYGDHVLIMEGTAAVDLDVLPSDRHATYAAKYHEPLAHWALDVAQTAQEFCVAVRITPTRVRAW